MTSSRSGFTIVEVLIAIILLSMGVLALAGSQALTTRMLADGSRQTQAAEVAARRFELLRLQSHQGATRCSAASLSAGTYGPQTSALDAATTAFREYWIIGPAGVSGTSPRSVTDSVIYQTPQGQKVSVFQSTIGCL